MDSAWMGGSMRQNLVERVARACWEKQSHPTESWENDADQEIWCYIAEVAIREIHAWRLDMLSQAARPN